MSLVGFDVARAADRGDIAEKMVRKLRTGHDAAEGPRAQPDAATRLALVTRARDDARRGRGGASESRPPVVPATEPRGIRGRDPRAVRPRHRRQRVPAGRHDQRGLRQHRRRADAVGHGDAGLHARRGVREPRRRWATRPPIPSSTHLRRAANAVAEGSRRRRAVRHARRHRRHAQLSGRRQVQVPAAAARRADRRCSSAAPCATSRWKSRSTASAPRS